MMEQEAVTEERARAGGVRLGRRANAVDEGSVSVVLRDVDGERAGSRATVDRAIRLVGLGCVARASDGGMGMALGRGVPGAVLTLRLRCVACVCSEK